ncbi:unnamed protein product [Calicophoron daubneyi]|uniref:Uncharacterized protein n=1 Tax=Calicophoron daubneyi TaxID=300641 RepID=A0AAV2TC85_CALDB
MEETSLAGKIALITELAPIGVRVNSIHPESTNTPILLHSGYLEKKNKDFLEAIKAKHPIGRYAEPIEMARAIAFLASPAASFITATLIPVDGRFTAKCEYQLTALAHPL